MIQWLHINIYKVAIRTQPFSQHGSNANRIILTKTKNNDNQKATRKQYTFTNQNYTIRIFEFIISDIWMTPLFKHRLGQLFGFHTSKHSHSNILQHISRRIQISCTKLIYSDILGSTTNVSFVIQNDNRKQI